MSIDALSLGVIAITLLILLATKELAMIKDTKFNGHFSKSLNAPIIVMVALFVLSIAFRIITFLRTTPQ